MFPLAYLRGDLNWHHAFRARNWENHGVTLGVGAGVSACVESKSINAKTVHKLFCLFSCLFILTQLNPARSYNYHSRCPGCIRSRPHKDSRSSAPGTPLPQRGGWCRTQACRSNPGGSSHHRGFAPHHFAAPSSLTFSAMWISLRIWTMHSS